MSDSPADSVMAVPNPPGRGGACGAVNTPAPPFYSARREQRAAEQAQRVGDRWHKSTGEADAGAKVSLPTTGGLSDAAKPTLKPYWRRSPWWFWT